MRSIQDHGVADETAQRRAGRIGKCLCARFLVHRLVQPDFDELVREQSSIDRSDHALAGPVLAHLNYGVQLVRQGPQCLALAAVELGSGHAGDSAESTGEVQEGGSEK